jgi:hypothetical protein
MIQYLCGNGDSLSALTTIFFLLPWDGPLAHLPWQVVTPEPHSFTLLVVLGLIRMRRWSLTTEYTRFVERHSPFGGIKGLENICQLQLYEAFQQWQPTTNLFASKIEPFLNRDLPPGLSDIYPESITSILNCRRQLLEREEIFVLNVMLEISPERYQRYNTPVSRSSTSLREVYNELLAFIGPEFGELTGQFLTVEEWSDVSGEDPRGQLWLLDTKRRYYEVEFLASPGKPANHFSFHRVGDYRDSVTSFKILLMRTSIPIHQGLPNAGKPKNYTVCVMDGTLSNAPLATLQVYPKWDYTTFATQVVTQLMDDCPSFQALWDHWRVTEVVNRGDIRVFLLPHRVDGLIYTMLALLCDNGRIGEEILSTLLHEVIWGGTSHNLLLSEMIPSPLDCNLLILVGRAYRREWLPLGTCEEFTVTTAETFQEYIYRRLGPWCGDRNEFHSYTHLHRLPYLYGTLYYWFLNEPAIIISVQDVLRAIYDAADEDTEEFMLQYSNDWGGHLIVSINI